MNISNWIKKILIMILGNTERKNTKFISKVFVKNPKKDFYFLNLGPHYGGLKSSDQIFFVIPASFMVPYNILKFEANPTKGNWFTHLCKKS